MYRIGYHFCWIPKYRRKVFTKGLKKSMKDILRQIAYEYEWDIKEMEVMDDHIHLLLSASPKESPAGIVRVLKSKSAREFFQRHPEVKKKYFWGGKLWTSSYFVETVGNNTCAHMEAYIREQQKELEKRLKEMKLF